MADGTYQDKTYRKQGGDEFVVAAGGKIRLESTGEIELEDGGFFTIDNETLSTAELQAVIRNTKAITITNQSTTDTVLSANGGSAAPVLQSEYGIFLFSCSDGMTNGSARLYSGLLGQRLRLQFTQNDGNNASLVFHASGNDVFTGVSLIASNGIALSSISIHQSATSFGWLELLCIQNGTWAVVTEANAVICTEFPAA